MRLLTAITLLLYASNRIGAKTSFYTEIARCINFAGGVRARNDIVALNYSLRSLCSSPFSKR